MSYNDGHIKDILSLSDEEREKAFHDFAEGSQILEVLLNESYDLGLTTLACCGGHLRKSNYEYDSNPYIAFRIDEKSSYLFSRFLELTSNLEGASTTISSHNNGGRIDCLISARVEDRDLLFSGVLEAINTNNYEIDPFYKTIKYFNMVGLDTYFTTNYDNRQKGIVQAGYYPGIYYIYSLDDVPENYIDVQEFSTKLDDEGLIAPNSGYVTDADALMMGELLADKIAQNGRKR